MKMRVSEIRVKRIRVNQGLGVYRNEVYEYLLNAVKRPGDREQKKFILKSCARNSPFVRDK